MSKSVYNGQQVDIVAFTSGDQVYVNLAGQVVYVVQMQVQTAYCTVAVVAVVAGGSGFSESR